MVSREIDECYAPEGLVVAEEAGDESAGLEKNDRKSCLIGAMRGKGIDREGNWYIVRSR